MKALQLWQPWASLIVIGAKRVETRKWNLEPGRDGVEAGDRIAITATKGNYDKRFAGDDPAMSALAAARLDPAALPVGAIVGTVIVKRVQLMTPQLIAAVGANDPREIQFGDWTPGRYAWLLGAPLMLEEPIPVKGRQARFIDVEDPMAIEGVRLVDARHRAVQPPPAPPGASVTPEPPLFHQESLL